jgi:hypothetical protein
MAELLRPAEKPKWAETGSVITPSNTTQDSGWTGPPQKPPYQWFNWLAVWTYRWINWFEARIDKSFGAQSSFQILTISNGIIAPIQSDNLIDTEGATSTDDLTNIITSDLDEGRIVILRAANPARAVVVKHQSGGAGQIVLAYGSDFNLTGVLALKKVGTQWVEIFRSTNAVENAVNVSSSGITPKVTGLDLGSASFRFDAFISTLDVSQIASSLIPDANNTRNIGQPGNSYANEYVQNIDSSTSLTTLNIGATNATIINIGRVFKDTLVTYNKGGTAGTGGDSGFEIEESGTATGFFKSSSDRNTFNLKNPNRSGIRRFRSLESAGFFEGSISLDALANGFDVKAGETAVMHSMIVGANTINNLGTLVTGNADHTSGVVINTGGTYISQY